MQSRKPNNMQPSLDQTSTHQYIISFQRSGSKVWIKSFRKVWIGGLDRVWERGLIQTLHFEPQPYIYNMFLRIYTTTMHCYVEYFLHNFSSAMCQEYVTKFQWQTLSENCANIIMLPPCLWPLTTKSKLMLAKKSSAKKNELRNRGFCLKTLPSDDVDDMTLISGWTPYIPCFPTNSKSTFGGIQMAFQGVWVTVWWSCHPPRQKIRPH